MSCAASWTLRRFGCARTIAQHLLYPVSPVSTGRWFSTATRQWSTPLARTLASAIQVTGPIPIASYMRQVLTSPEGGYYTTGPEGGRDLFGKSGDFVTSPEISQGRKSSGVYLMEVGPGKATLMDDILRTIRNFKSFAKSIETIYLVEASPALRGLQKKRLCGDSLPMEETDIGHRSISKHLGVPVVWVEDIRLLPRNDNGDKAPFIFAHEFFDALPIHAFESTPPAPEGRRPDHEILTPTGPAKLHQPPTHLKTSDTPQWRELMVALNPKAVEGDLKHEPEFTLVRAKASTPSSLVLPEISERYRALKSLPGSTIEISPESRIYAADFACRIGGSLRTVRESGAPVASATVSTAARRQQQPPGAAEPPQPKMRSSPSGAALIMDYGTMNSIPTNSLRGIKSHQKVPPLSFPGQVDVSADVDFAALAEAAIEASDGVEVHGPVEQGDFLCAMGIAERMEQLLASISDEEKRRTLQSGWRRLTERGGGGMGKVYKVMAIIPENGGRRRPVGFGGSVIE